MKEDEISVPTSGEGKSQAGVPKACFFFLLGISVYSLGRVVIFLEASQAWLFVDALTMDELIAVDVLHAAIFV